eukprot:1522739-Prymnesium_polylepis.1
MLPSPALTYDTTCSDNHATATRGRVSERACLENVEPLEHRVVQGRERDVVHNLDGREHLDETDQDAQPGVQL